jgi:hypothetical protein
LLLFCPIIVSKRVFKTCFTTSLGIVTEDEDADADGDVLLFDDVGECGCVCVLTVLVFEVEA